MSQATAFYTCNKNTHLREQKLNLYSIMCCHKKHDITHFVCSFYGICKMALITRIRWSFLCYLDPVLYSCRLNYNISYLLLFFNLTYCVISISYNFKIQSIGLGRRLVKIIIRIKSTSKLIIILVKIWFLKTLQLPFCTNA